MPDAPVSRLMPCAVCVHEQHLLDCDFCDCSSPAIPGVTF